MLDLSTLYAKDTIEVELRHPVTKASLGAFITVCGSTSDTYTNAQVEAYARMRGDLKEGEKIPAEMAAEALKDVVIQCIKGWRGITRDGEEVPYSPEEARRILSAPGYGWLRDQVTDAINDVRRFF